MQVPPSSPLLEALSTLNAVESEPRPAAPTEAEAAAREAPPAEGAATPSGSRGHLGRFVDITV